MELSDDSELIKNFKNFIRQADELDEIEYQNPDNPIDFEILNIRLSLNWEYSGTGQFGVHEKWDAIETFEAITNKIYENLESNNKTTKVKQFIKLVNIGAGGSQGNILSGYSSSYISADKLLKFGPKNVSKIKHKLGKYLTEYYDNDEDDEDDEDEDDEDNEDESSEEDKENPTTENIDAEEDPPKLHVINIGWISKDPELIYRFLSMIPNSIHFSKIYDGYESNKDPIYYFKGIIWYWGSHYFLYIRKDDQWIQINDISIKIETNWTSIVQDFITGKILPVMLLFERCDNKEEKRIAKQSLVLEDDYLTGIVKSNTADNILERIHNDNAWFCESCKGLNNGLLEQCEYCTAYKTSNSPMIGSEHIQAITDVPEVNENQWICNKCTAINSDQIYKCFVWGNKNEIIKTLILQRRMAERTYRQPFDQLFGQPVQSPFEQNFEPYIEQNFWGFCKKNYSGNEWSSCREMALLYNGDVEGRAIEVDEFRT